MKKELKVLLGIIAAGAAASAAAVAINRHRNSRGDFIFEEDDPFDEDEYDSDGDYGLTHEEDELIRTDDYDFGTSDDDYYPGKYDDISILEEEEVAFVKYLLEGIRNAGYLMSAKYDDIERICRRRNISNADKMERIRAICQAENENYDLIVGCTEDIADMVEEKTPEDFWEFYADYEESEGNSNAE